VRRRRDGTLATFKGDLRHWCVPSWWATLIQMTAKGPLAEANRRAAAPAIPGNRRKPNYHLRVSADTRREIGYAIPVR